MAIYGRSGSDNIFGYLGVNTARVSVFNAMTEHGWGYEMGGKIARWHLNGTTVKTRMAIFDENGPPGRLQGYTAEITVSNAADEVADATARTAAITATTQPDNPSETAVMLWSGRRYAMGYITRDGQLFHQMVQASQSPYLDNNMYERAVASTVPSNPYGHTSSMDYEGVLNIYIEYEPNVAPSKPVSDTMEPNGFTTSLSPVFRANFVDGNSDRGDYLNQSNIQLRAVGTTTNKWNSTYNATADEKLNDEAAISYGGSALVAGTQYEWRIRFSDAFGAWGSWSDWVQFTVNAGGTVATPTAPTGKQETNSPTPFSAVWSHGSGLSTNAAEIRIKSGNTVIRGPYQKAVTVANGGTISFTWAETGFAALNWGGSYTVEIRARDTGNLWSNWSTPGGAFTTNASPSVPTNLSPASGSTTSSYPLITFTMTDTDDTTATGLTAEVRIKDNAGTLLFTRTATFDAALNKWKYQVTSTDFASHATYKWDARGYDGTLYSGYSTEQSVAYGPGPTVTNVQINGVAANGSTPASNTPTITWTLTGSTQQSFRVQIYAYPYVVGATPIYDSGTVTSATASHTVPSGFLHNLTAYDLVLTVTNTVPLSGTFGAYTFTVTFPAPTPIQGFQAFPELDTVFLSWLAPDIPPSSFVENILIRRPVGGGNHHDPEVILARLTSLDQTTFTDHFPASGKAYEYAIYLVVYQGTDVTEASPAVAVATVFFEDVIVKSTANPTGLSLSLRILRSFSIDHKGEQQLEFPWGTIEPIIIVSPVHYHVLTGTFLLYNTDTQTVEDAIDALGSMEEHAEVVCIRDTRGVKVFGRMTFKEDYAELHRSIVTITLTQSNFREGITEQGIFA